jgi:plastocyanin
MGRNILAIIMALAYGLTGLCSGAGFVLAEEAEKGMRADKIKGEEIGHFIIRVRGEKDGLLPKRATVKQGTTVIWLNQTGDYIEIAFTGDQKVDVACRAPVHFVAGSGGDYISDKIPFGAVASLCFIEKGTYQYSAIATSMYKGGGLLSRERLSGVIIVE